MIGATTSQTLDLTLINKGDIVYGTSTIKVEIGLKIGSTVEYIPIGIYNIDDIEKTDYTIKITAYDNMIKFERYFMTTLGDTLTLQQVVSELTRITGVQFTGTLPSCTVKKLEGFSCREILSYVASICGGNAAITRDGKFTIVTPKDNSYSIGTSNYFDYKREETKYKIGKISCQVGEEVLSKGSLGADSMELQFDNPWINATTLTDIYNKLNGFEYLGYSMKWQGDPCVDVGDIVTITDKKGVVRKHPILSQKFTYTGGLTSEISAKGENKNKNEFSSSGSNTNKISRLVTEQAVIKEALIGKANITDLIATNAEINNLKVKNAEIESALIKKATIEQLNATNANIQNLIAADANIINLVSAKANITDLTATNIKFNVGSGGTLDLQTLLSKFVTGESGQFLNITSSNTVIANAVIKDTIAANISVQDLKAGNIDANRFNIVGTNGNLLIKDNTIQIKDSNRVRVQIGKDASNDYSMYVWDATGKLMFDATGLKADGIKSKIIRDDMVSDTANISGSKINISSLITEINKDTNTQIIKGSKVYLDTIGQSLEVSFNSLKTSSDDTKSKTESNTTSIGTINGQIDTLIKDTTIEENGSTIKLKDSYSSLKQTVNGINTTVASHTTSITNLGTNVTNAQNTANSANTLADSKAKVFTATPTTPYKVGDIWTGGPSGELMKCKVARASGTYTASDWEKASKYTDDTKANAVEGSLNTLSGKVTTVESNYISLSQNLEGFKTTVSNTYSTKTELSGVDGKVSSLTNRVSTAESSITQLNNKINLKVEQTDITNTVNGIQVGGRNLVGLTKMEQNWLAWNASRGTTALTSEGTKLTSIATGQNAIVSSLTINPKIDDIFTVRFRAKGNLTALEVYLLATSGTNEREYYIANASTIINEETFTEIKVTFTFKNTNTNPTNRLFIGGQFTSIGQWLEVERQSVKLERGNKATDWTPAPEDLDQAITTVDGRVTTLNTSLTTTNNKVATIETNLNSITSRVSSTESSITTINGNVSSLQTRMSSAETKITDSAIVSTVRSSTAYTSDLSAKANQSALNTTNTNVTGLTTRVNAVEQSITATAITTTISSAISDGTSSITTTQFVMDKNGLTIKNGALTIKNKAGTNVLTSDTNGNLTITGNFTTTNSGQKAVEIVSQTINLYDWEGTTRTTPVGTIFSGRRIINGSTSALPGYVVANDKSAYLSLAYKNSNGNYSDYILLDKDGVSGQGGSFPIWVQENIIVNSTLGIRGPSSKTYSRIWNSNNVLTTEISTANAGDGYQIQTTSGSVLFNIIAGRSYPVLFNTNLQISGNYTATGSKNSLQSTKNYGERLINAFETAEYYYSDIGFGKINDNGECYINIDDILQECINLDCEYHIFIQKYNGDITSIDKHRDYFVAKGKVETEFSWQYIAKRKNYENVRLDTPEIGTIEDIPVFTDEDLKSDTSEDILLQELDFKLEDILMEEI